MPNPALRNVVEKAKKDNVPGHVIDKAIQKAAGKGGEDFQPVRYEGFGPGGALIIVECLTDNNQRTIAEIRSYFVRAGAKLAASGSVVMSFDHLAVISFKGDSEEKVIEALRGDLQPRFLNPSNSMGLPIAIGSPRPITAICPEIPEFTQINKSGECCSPIDRLPEEPITGASMTSLHESGGKGIKKSQTAKSGADRRVHRRHDMEPQGITVERVDANRRQCEALGEIVDISASGVRIRTADAKFRADNQVRVRLALPAYAGISPFIDTTAGQAEPKREWTGWLSIARVQPVSGDKFDVAGRLVDMEEMDRGMLSLYLSTQPLAA